MGLKIMKREGHNMWTEGGGRRRRRKKEVCTGIQTSRAKKCDLW
jgi:hypothetical protein